MKKIKIGVLCILSVVYIILWSWICYEAFSRNTTGGFVLVGAITIPIAFIILLVKKITYQLLEK